MVPGTREVLATDFGGTLSTLETQKLMDHPELYSDVELMTGAIDVLAGLVNERFGPDGVIMISKCDSETEERTRQYLTIIDFYRRTGILPANILFTRERQGKGPIAVERGVTHAIDDRLEVLGIIGEALRAKRRKDGLPPIPLGRPSQLYLINPKGEEVAAHLHHLPQVRSVAGWNHIGAILLPN